MSESIKNKLLETDLYKLFDVEEDSPVELIKKAYRKKALELHPDKNLGNKEEAEEKFVELGKAFEILADKSARAAYDAVRKAKREKAKRDLLLDEKRRKLKEDLEKREQAAKEKFERKTEFLKKTKEEEWFKNEVDRLRREGSKLLEEEINYINQQIRQEKKRAQEQEPEKKNTDKIIQPARIKINWQLNKASADKIKFDHALLEHLFSKYGEIDVLVVSKKSSAILEYKNTNDAIKCLNDESNLKATYSISLTWLGDSNLDRTESKIEKEPILINNNLDTMNSFEEMEMAILKKLKAASK